MGIDKQRILEGVRISQGWLTTDEDISLLIEGLNEVLKFL
jgi:cysteine sulfinate desulfinase/cysteine desulfurase-like protein